MKTTLRYAHLAATCIAAKGMRLTGHPQEGELLRRSPVTDYDSARTARYRTAGLAKQLEHQRTAPGYVAPGTAELVHMLWAASAACACEMTQLGDQDRIDRRTAELTLNANRWLKAAQEAMKHDHWKRAPSARRRLALGARHAARPVAAL